MIKGIIFDCFGVLYEGSLQYLAELAPADQRERIYDASRSADYGYSSRADFIGVVAEVIGRSPSEIEAIASGQHVLNAPLIDYVRLLRKTHKTAMLSNVGRSVMNTLFTAEDLTELFDAIVLSSDVGMIKPHADIYELTASKLGLLPEECIMIDDSPRNVEGAELAGMAGLLYSSTEQVKSEVGRLIKTEGADA